MTEFFSTDRDELDAVTAPRGSARACGRPDRRIVRADKGRVELFTRFLFGALIDADRTATARFYARHSPALTNADLRYDDIPTLAARLDAAIDAMPPKGSPAMVALRREVLAACRAAAPKPPGRFTLTVPTGGGKTFSAMSFALNHAKAHGLRRVIVVIPRGVDRHTEDGIRYRTVIASPLTQGRGLKPVGRRGAARA